MVFSFWSCTIARTTSLYTCHDLFFVRLTIMQGRSWFWIYAHTYVNGGLFSLKILAQICAKWVQVRASVQFGPVFDRCMFPLPLCWGFWMVVIYGRYARKCLPALWFWCVWDVGVRKRHRHIMGMLSVTCSHTVWYSGIVHIDLICSYDHIHPWLPYPSLFGCLATMFRSQS